MFELKLTV